MSAELAPLAGIELDGAPTEEFFIAGLKTAGTLARVNLTVTDGAEEFSWDRRRSRAAYVRPMSRNSSVRLTGTDDLRVCLPPSRRSRPSGG
jgi:hypothetical protein